MSIFDLIPDLPMINAIDVGAMIFEDEPPPYQTLLEQGRARVIGFEPNATECVKLNERARANERHYPYFAGSGGEAVYHETNYAMTGSLYPPNRPLVEKFTFLPEFTVPKRQHAVRTQRLDDLAQIEGLHDADYIKIDVQGAELDVFKGASKVLAAATVVQTEVEFVQIYENQPLFADVDIHLRQAGYQFHFFRYIMGRCFAPFHVPTKPTANIRQLLWADAIYVRDFQRLNALSVDKLLKMAVLLDTIYQSVDLVALVLAEVDRQRGSRLSPDYLSMLMAQRGLAKPVGG